MTGKMKSPLRYPGGKSRAVKTICSYIPEAEKVLCSPFMGGGSVELACAGRMEVRGYDSSAPLVDFWNALMDAPELLALAVEAHYPLSMRVFIELQMRLADSGPLALGGSLSKAAAFYALNRASFSGTTLSGGMLPNEITAISDLVSKGQLSVEMLWDTLKRGEVLPETFDAEIEAERIGGRSPVGAVFGAQGNEK